MPCGGFRPGSGRKPHPPSSRSHQLNIAIPPLVWAELEKREAKTGVYPTAIIRSILTDVLIGGLNYPSNFDIH
jgi:hypothetical protein